MPRLVMPVFSMDQSHIKATGNCRERPIQVAVHEPRRAPRAEIRALIRQCRCGGTASHDGYCRRCRPAKAAKPKPIHKKRHRHNEPRHKRDVVFPVQSYSKRNEILSGLGFTSYSEYLQSPLWQAIRSRVLKSSPLCLKCEHKAEQVHHATYTKDNLSGETTVGLFSICSACHKWAEFDEAGNKLPLHAANKRLGITNKTKHQRPKTKAQRKVIRDECVRYRKSRRRTVCPRCGHAVLHEGRLCSECLRKVMSSTEKSRDGIGLCCARQRTGYRREPSL